MIGPYGLKLLAVAFLVWASSTLVQALLTSSSVVRDVDSPPVVILSAEQAKHVGDEENQQYCPQPYAGPAARTPPRMAVVPSTEAKNQY